MPVGTGQQVKGQDDGDVFPAAAVLLEPELHVLELGDRVFQVRRTPGPQDKTEAKKEAPRPVAPPRRRDGGSGNQGSLL